MNVNFNSIKTTIKSIPNRAIQETGKVGAFVIKKGQDAIKKLNYEKPDTFELKNKETIVGIGVLSVATILALKCIKGIHKKIKEMREK